MIQAHLRQHAPSLHEYLDTFIQAQGMTNTELTPDAKQILATIRAEIQQCFIEQVFETDELTEFASKVKCTDSTLMVRSSGEEDSVELANLGRNESIAAVEPDPKNISAAIGKVGASYFSEKSLAQRLLSRRSDITKPDFIPVLLQRMVVEPIHGFADDEAIISSDVMYTSDGFTRWINNDW